MIVCRAKRMLKSKCKYLNSAVLLSSVFLLQACGRSEYAPEKVSNEDVQRIKQDIPKYKESAIKKLAAWQAPKRAKNKNQEKLEAKTNKLQKEFDALMSSIEKDSLNYINKKLPLTKRKIANLKGSQKEKFIKTLKEKNCKTVIELMDLDLKNTMNWLRGGMREMQKWTGFPGVTPYGHSSFLIHVYGFRPSNRLKSKVKEMYKKLAKEVLFTKRSRMKNQYYFGSLKTFGEKLKTIDIEKLVPSITSQYIDIFDMGSGLSKIYEYTLKKEYLRKHNGKGANSYALDEYLLENGISGISSKYVPAEYIKNGDELIAFLNLCNKYHNAKYQLKIAEIKNSSNALAKVNSTQLAVDVYNAQDESTLKKVGDLNQPIGKYYLFDTVALQALGTGKCRFRSRYFQNIIGKCVNPKFRKYAFDNNKSYRIVAKYKGTMTYNSLLGKVQAVKLDILYIRPLQ